MKIDIDDIKKLLQICKKNFFLLIITIFSFLLLIINSFFSINDYKYSLNKKKIIMEKINLFNDDVSKHQLELDNIDKDYIKENKKIENLISTSKEKDKIKNLKMNLNTVNSYFLEYPIFPNFMYQLSIMFNEEYPYPQDLYELKKEIIDEESFPGITGIMDKKNILNLQLMNEKTKSYINKLQNPEYNFFLKIFKNDVINSLIVKHKKDLLKIKNKKYDRVINEFKLAYIAGLKNQNHFLIKKINNTVEYKIRHIYKKKKMSSSDSQGDTYLIMRKIFIELKTNPASFSKLARQYSDDKQTAKNSGIVGWSKLSKYDNQFKDQVNKMHRPGDIRLFETNSGYHIVKYLAKRKVKSTDEDINKILIPFYKKNKLYLSIINSINTHKLLFYIKNNYPKKINEVINELRKRNKIFSKKSEKIMQKVISLQNKKNEISGKITSITNNIKSLQIIISQELSQKEIANKIFQDLRKIYKVTGISVSYIIVLQISPIILVIIYFWFFVYFNRLCSLLSIFNSNQKRKINVELDWFVLYRDKIINAFAILAFILPSIYLIILFIFSNFYYKNFILQLEQAIQFPNNLHLKYFFINLSITLILIIISILTHKVITNIRNIHKLEKIIINKRVAIHR